MTLYIIAILIIQLCHLLKGFTVPPPPDHDLDLCPTETVFPLDQLCLFRDSLVIDMDQECFLPDSITRRAEKRKLSVCSPEISSPPSKAPCSRVTLGSRDELGSRSWCSAGDDVYSRDKNNKLMCKVEPAAVAAAGTEKIQSCSTGIMSPQSPACPKDVSRDLSLGSVDPKLIMCTTADHVKVQHATGTCDVRQEVVDQSVINRIKACQPEEAETSTRLFLDEIDIVDCHAHWHEKKYRGEKEVCTHRDGWFLWNNKTHGICYIPPHLWPGRGWSYWMERVQHTVHPCPAHAFDGIRIPQVELNTTIPECTMESFPKRKDKSGFVCKFQRQFMYYYNKTRVLCRLPRQHWPIYYLDTYTTCTKDLLTSAVISSGKNLLNKSSSATIKDATARLEASFGMLQRQAPTSSAAAVQMAATRGTKQNRAVRKSYGKTVKQLLENRIAALKQSQLSVQVKGVVITLKPQRMRRQDSRVTAVQVSFKVQFSGENVTQLDLASEVRESLLRSPERLEMDLLPGLVLDPQSIVVQRVGSRHSSPTSSNVNTPLLAVSASLAVAVVIILLLSAVYSVMSRPRAVMHC